MTVIVCYARGFPIRRIMQCRTCKTRRRMVALDEVWYGTSLTCCALGIPQLILAGTETAGEAELLRARGVAHVLPNAEGELDARGSVGEGGGGRLGAAPAGDEEPGQ